MAGIRDSIRKVYDVIHSDGLYLQLWDELFPEDESWHVLTVYSYERAREELSRFRHHVAGKKVVELGAGVGLLAYEMSKYAELVIAVEWDPLWVRVYLKHIHPKVLKERRPLLFAVGDMRYLTKLNPGFDVAVIYTHSAINNFILIERFKTKEKGES